jgi:hypothetical protein
MTNKFQLRSLLALSSALVLSGTAMATSPIGSTILVAENTPLSYVQTSSTLTQLAPQIETSNTRLNYDVLDDALGGTVIRLGPSTRRHMGRPNPQVGSRQVTGHTSAYRLEGSRVSFSFFNEEYLTELTDYRKDLERIGTQIDLIHMSRDEQLAYWLNLHNVAMIEQVSNQYPTKYPSELEIGGVNIDDAKILNIKGVALSLRDIREGIVYPNWTNPNVIYGFFRGDIGSPGLQNYAYTGTNVNELLKIQAVEFVNSLRGFKLTSRNRNVSKLYDEAKRFYFPNWEADITSHLLKHARDDVAEDIRKNRPYKVDRYDRVVADLVGGSRPRIAGFNIDQPGTLATADLPYEVLQLLRELDTKTRVLRRRKLIGTGRGTVTIEDIETIDVDVPVTKTPN